MRELVTDYRKLIALYQVTMALGFARARNVGSLALELNLVDWHASLNAIIAGLRAWAPEPLKVNAIAPR
jgi:hypothetical protein